jgi:general secretion pathway protein D
MKFDRSDCTRALRRAPRVLSAGLAATALLLASGCYHPLPDNISSAHISATNTKIEPEGVPAPARTSSFVPQPKATIKPPTFSVVVNEVPVKDLLFALARDSKQNIDVHPGIQGLVTLNAVNETLPAILERISKQVEMRYRIEGNSIVVSPDTPYFKVYRVNYINMQRDSTSSIGASGQITGQSTSGGGSSGGASGSSSGGASGSSGGNNSSSVQIKTTANTNFWELLSANIRSILNSSRNQSQTAEAKQAQAEQTRTQREERIAQAEAVARAGPGATQLFNTVFSNQPAPQVPGDIRDSIVVNAMAGTVNVFASEKQHHLIQQFLDGIGVSVQRQVLIEATIAEVQLNSEYQAGVDWSRLATNVGNGLNLTQSFLGAGNFTPGSITIGYTNPTSRFGNISGSIQLLAQFGRTRVLSSPKLMALNNQTSVLKVVDNFVYFNVEAQQGAVVAGGVVQPPVFNTTPQTVPVGVIMSVTPQINEDGRVTLTVRPTITRVVDTVQDPNPSLRVCTTTALVTTCSTIPNLVPVIQAREMESVLQVGSGQTVVMGGLMQDEVSRKRNYIPGLGIIAGIGEIFGYRDDKVEKSELVIFLKPTVITTPSLDSEELKPFQRYLPQPGVDPTLRSQGNPPQIRMKDGDLALEPLAK